jgi:O-antigen ligase
MNATQPTRSGLGAGHLAWLAMFCSILIWNMGEVRPGELGNTSNWYRITLVLFAAAATAFGLLKTASRLSQGFCGPVVLLLGYGVLGMVSALYIPQYSLYSMWKASELVLDVLAIAVVMSHPRPQASARIAYNTILVLFAVLMLAYWAEALLLPSTAFLPSRGLIPYALQGVMPIMNGNALAFMSAVLAFAAWCRLLTRRGGARIFWLALLLLAFGMLILAQSRTSLIGFAIAVGVQLFFERRFGLLLLFSMLGAVVVASTEFLTVTEEYLVRGQSRELFGSLSGRTPAWQAAWISFQQSPVIGHGFAAGARAEILGTTGASTLHGAVFDVLVGVGLLGFIPWAAAILWTSLRLVGLGLRGWPRRRHGTLDRGALAEMLGVLALILVRSTTSSGLALHDHTFMLFLVVLAFTTATSHAQRHAQVTRKRDHARGFAGVRVNAAEQAEASVKA